MALYRIRLAPTPQFSVPPVHNFQPLLNVLDCSLPSILTLCSPVRIMYSQGEAVPMLKHRGEVEIKIHLFPTVTLDADSRLHPSVPTVKKSGRIWNQPGHVKRQILVSVRNQTLVVQPNTRTTQNFSILST